MSLEQHFVTEDPIMDSIYGVIKLTLFEKQIIATKEMQRLRGIKQLGFVNLVFPNAEHSRFSHSIGVCHQAKKLIKYVSENFRNEPKLQDWRDRYSSIRRDEKEKEKEKKKAFTECEKILISVTALLHDIPHSPFSHEIETHDSNGSGIPVHDDFRNNPIFFLYLFDKKSSDLAKVIEAYNSHFWLMLKGEKEWAGILKKSTSIDENGYIIVNKFKEKITESTLTSLSSNSIYEKLPVLGVMIFEILLFDKVDMWLTYDKSSNTYQPNSRGIDVRVNFAGDTINWKPIQNWFRPYRKDIIANTICADLLDYLIRDGVNTGLISALDLKFFDRMTICKAIPDKTETLIPLDKLPDFCEHIVFDIFDHKRGIIRQSIITEIIAFLQQRYLLAERVYNHRVVEGARAMLQEVSRLLVESNSIKLEQLHDTGADKGMPVGDESFFSWVLNLDDTNNINIRKAKNLVNLLRTRRIFREAVIIDAPLDSNVGSYRGTDVNCKTLADALLDEKSRDNILNMLVNEVAKYFSDNPEEAIDAPDYKNEQIFVVGVRKWGKRYKIPRVLVCRPLKTNHENDIEVLPLFEGKKLPSINNRLESMQHAYNSLWKVYLFIHPYFHQKRFKQLHIRLADTFINLLSNETHITWENSILSYEDLLPKYPIDIVTFVNDQLPVNSSFDKDDFIDKIIQMVNSSMPSDFQGQKIQRSDRKALVSKLQKRSRQIFGDKQIQQKVIKALPNFSPQSYVLGGEGNESIIDNLVEFISKISHDSEELF